MKNDGIIMKEHKKSIDRRIKYDFRNYELMSVLFITYKI